MMRGIKCNKKGMFARASILITGLLRLHWKKLNLKHVSRITTIF